MNSKKMNSKKFMLTNIMRLFSDYSIKVSNKTSITYYIFLYSDLLRCIPR